MRDTVLVVGSGAREHALAWAIAQSPLVERTLVAPGNAGTALVAENVAVAVDDIQGLTRLAEEQHVDLVVVGPELPLALGLADALGARGIRVVGPNAAAARIESSKAYAKELMIRSGVATARFQVVEQEQEALRAIDDLGGAVAVKADGLSAGKGVIVCTEASQAQSAVRDILGGRFGDAGRRIIIEELLRGPEVSLLALVDGEQASALPLARDHKRLGDGDTGPNTGGMGAVAPVPGIGAAQRSEWLRTCVQPVVDALRDAGTPYRGVLFAGLMLTPNGPRVLEYNCRLGDPEAQVVLPLLDGDVVPWLQEVAGGRLSSDIPVRDAAATGVVLAAAGYPEQPERAVPIEGLDVEMPDVLTFHGGTARDSSGQVVTAGGRALTVVGLGPTAAEATTRAYAAPVRFRGMQRRSDIGRAVSAANEPGPSGAPPAGNRTITDIPRGIVVMASGEGTNLQALLVASQSSRLTEPIVAVISHNPEAGALRRAGSAGVPAYAIGPVNRRDPAERRHMEERILALISQYNPRAVVLAGWMVIVSEQFLRRVGRPVVNVHPALLPIAGGPRDTLDDIPGQTGFPVLRGAHAVRDAIELRLPYTGVSIHHVTADVDAGPVLAREIVSIEETDDEQSLYRRIRAVEHRLLVDTVCSFVRA